MIPTIQDMQPLRKALAQSQLTNSYSEIRKLHATLSARPRDILSDMKPEGVGGNIRGLDFGFTARVVSSTGALPAMDCTASSSMPLRRGIMKLAMWFARSSQNAQIPALPVQTR